MENIRIVAPTEFARELETGKISLVDVRHADEYASGHIAGAVNIDVQQDDFMRRATEALDRGQAVAVYCGTGKRAGEAARLLADAGYTVVDLDGGLANWESAGLPIVS